MRQILIVLVVAGGMIAPMASAQSVQGTDTRLSTAGASSTSPATAPMASKAHRAMASFTSLLREAALQSQAAQRATASAPSVKPAARPAPDARDALASTPDPAAIH